MKALGTLPRGIAAAGALALFTSCAAIDSTGRVRDLDAALRARALNPAAVVVPFAVSDSMRVWARAQVNADAPPKEKLRQLLSALLAKEGMNLEYQSDNTATAEEVFASGRANCLSFTNIFVGLAREIDVPAYFVEVKDLQGFTKEGDLIIVSGHVTAGYGDKSDQTLLDFTLGQAKAYRQVRTISDLTAISMFYSNRGARLLRDGDNPSAERWLATAVALDAGLPGAWVNYGVALRRLGKMDAAQTAYRKALEVDPNALSAYQNLAALLRMEGKESEAMDLLAFVDRRDNKNPWSYLDLGDLNLRHGRVVEAERFYQRAMRLANDDPEPYSAMGLLSLQSGDSTGARKWLRKAEHQGGPKGTRTEQLAQRLNAAPATPVRSAQRRQPSIPPSQTSFASPPSLN